MKGMMTHLFVTFFDCHSNTLLTILNFPAFYVNYIIVDEYTTRIIGNSPIADKARQLCFGHFFPPHRQASQRWLLSHIEGNQRTFVWDCCLLAHLVLKETRENLASYLYSNTFDINRSWKQA